MSRTGEPSVIVVSAPSGAGKRTVLAKVFEGDSSLVYGLSATTRAPREGEVEGRDYAFLDRAEFERRVEADDFVEWAEVHGNLYGTLRSHLDALLETGKDVVLEVDVQGMRSVKQALGGQVLTVFVMPPSLDALEARMRKRGANDEADMALRLENARVEMDARREFDYVVVNDDLAEAVEDFEKIMQAWRNR